MALSCVTSKLRMKLLELSMSRGITAMLERKLCLEEYLRT